MTPRRFLPLAASTTGGLAYVAVAYGGLVAVVVIALALATVTVAYLHEKHRRKRSVTDRARMVDELARRSR